MIGTALAQRLAAAGLHWRPAPGDHFCLSAAELGDEVFILSDMVIEARDHATGTVLAFNGTTEWALDAVSVDDALWLPCEEQLREMLGETFSGLERTPSGYRVTTRVRGASRADDAPDPADAYGWALLALLERGDVPAPPGRGMPTGGEREDRAAE